jgi:uncharacterized membrane protein YoaK (UPF0700 family)
MDASLSRDLALGTIALLLGAQITWLGARVCVRTMRVARQREKPLHRLIMVQFDLVVVGLLAILSVRKPRVPLPVEQMIARFGTAFLAIALIHALAMLFLVSRSLLHDPHLANRDTIMPCSAPDYPPPSGTDGVVTVLMVLTGVSGLIDAASFLGLGRFYLGKMTGNVETIGWSAVEVPGFLATNAGIALLAFLIGAVAAGRLSRRLRHRRPWWMASALVVEALLLLTALGDAITSRPDALSTGRFGLIILLALAMGFRNATTRKLAEPDMTTTLITSNLADLAADSILAGGHSPRLSRRIGVVTSIVVGAAIGGSLYARDGLLAPLALAATVATLLAIGYPLFLIGQGVAEYVRPTVGLLQHWLEHQNDHTRSLDERVRRLEETMSPDRRGDT